MVAVHAAAAAVMADDQRQTQMKNMRSGSVSDFRRERRGFLNTFALDSRNNFFSRRRSSLACTPASGDARRGPLVGCRPFLLETA